MNVWFDLHNSPHINMFRRLIGELQGEHEVIITARPLANTIDLLELHRLNYEVVGKHYGANIARKLAGVSRPSARLVPFSQGPFN